MAIPNIFVVSTKLRTGKGGISTALGGLAESEALSEEKIIYLSSHEQGRSWIPFCSSFWGLVTKTKQGDIVWLHCGPWFSMLRKTILALVARIKGAKVVFHFHSAKTRDYLEHKGGYVLLKLMCHLADGLVVLTPWWKDTFIRYLPETKDKLFVSPNPLDTRFLKEAAKPRRFSPDPPFELFTMTRLVEGKGVKDVIRALAVLPSHYLLTVAGDGPLEQDLSKLVQDLELSDRVQFVGWAGHEDKIKYLRQSDVFVLPSRFDSFGMGFIEAMACGTPVVALAVDAIPDVVPHEKAGILCSSSEPEDLTKAIEACMSEQQRLADFAQAYVTERYDSTSIAEALLAYFEKLSR